MITLYTFGPGLGLPDSSPFVMKAEMLLKLAGLEYRTVPTDVRKTPKGKLPYIDDDGARIADSTFIRWHIEQKYGVDFDRGLTPYQKAVAWSAEKMLEDNLYWIMVEARWLNEANFMRGPGEYFKGIPWPIRPLVTGMIRRSIRQALHGQGLGRHSPEERTAIAERDIASIAGILGDHRYLMGDHLSGTDATAFAFLAHLLCPVFDMPARTIVERHPNLVDYVARMTAAWYPERIA